MTQHNTTQDTTRKTQTQRIIECTLIGTIIASMFIYNLIPIFIAIFPIVIMFGIGFGFLFVYGSE